MAADSSSFDLLYVDDFYLSTLFDGEDDDQKHSDQGFEVSDGKYAEELQLQEALMASAMAAALAIANDVSSSYAPCSCSSSVLSRPVTVCVTPLTPTIENPSGETGCESESKSSPPPPSCLSFCEICVEKKESDRMFENESCLHSFCSECISKYVAAKINESQNAVISCPGLDCKSFIELEACRAMLPTKVIERWDEALCEALILASEKVYCPFKDCSAVLILEDERPAIMESECPICHRLFCAQCEVPWHPGIECEEYQRLNEEERGREDLLMRELAHERKWMRCPHCKYFVEKAEGCLHITCRCKFEFCYACGSDWSNTHGGCQPN